MIGSEVVRPKMPDPAATLFFTVTQKKATRGLETKYLRIFLGGDILFRVWCTEAGEELTQRASR